MGLPFGRDEDEKEKEKNLCGRISAIAGLKGPLSIHVTSNSVSVLSIRRSGTAVKLRIHRMFLDAGMDIIREVARFIKNGKKGERFPVLSRFIKENMGRPEKAGPEVPPRHPRGTLKPVGKYHNLAAVYESLNRVYFGGEVRCDIGWGRTSRKYAVKKRTLGSYWPASGRHGVIRINPVLDRKHVPSYYVSFVVYHEMLHAYLGVDLEDKKGRRLVHTREFRRRERLFSEHRKAMAWEARRSHFTPGGPLRHRASVI